MQELIGCKQLCEMLGMGRRKAIEFCQKHGVAPINSSSTEGRATLHWRLSSVMLMLDGLEAKSMPKEDYVPKTWKSPSVFKKPTKDLLKELKS